MNKLISPNILSVQSILATNYAFKFLSVVYKLFRIVKQHQEIHSLLVNLIAPSNFIFMFENENLLNREL